MSILRIVLITIVSFVGLTLYSRTFLDLWEIAEKEYSHTKKPIKRVLLFTQVVIISLFKTIWPFIYLIFLVFIALRILKWVAQVVGL